MRPVVCTVLLGCLLTACDREGEGNRGGDAGTTVIAPADPLPATRAPDAADAALTAAVEAELRAEPTLRELSLRVNARNGTVILEGTVDSIQSAQHAGVIAAAVDGVNQVDNRLAVNNPP